ncbi:hypothetical protein B0T24DRAFT_654860 [Lasiosphaeria ovina]|uniref:Uncharacterized protein n=1 Tax=Lasiosphaeria ovina TaxID=92902 RepID=A0AAE0KL77_9PEZI|nr:hypothetical protein B0T24DRAFT_654860 [Lasiosphaeria ovina]
MDDLPRSKIISDNPIGNGLDAFRASFSSACESANVSCTPDAFEQFGKKRLYSAISSNSFDFDRIKPLLKAALTDNPDDTLIWDRVYNATPWVYTTGALMNSSEYRHYIDQVLLRELGTLYIGLLLYEIYFGGVAGLEVASKTVFKKCKDGSNPLFSNGWSGWPAGAKEKDVLAWFRDLIPKLETFVEGLNSC